MNFTLITKQGRIYTFYLEATAQCYQRAYGGVIVTNQILSQTLEVMETDSSTEEDLLEI